MYQLNFFFLYIQGVRPFLKQVLVSVCILQSFEFVLVKHVFVFQHVVRAILYHCYVDCGRLFNKMLNKNVLMTLAALAMLHTNPMVALT